MFSGLNYTIYIPESYGNCTKLIYCQISLHFVGHAKFECFFIKQRKTLKNISPFCVDSCASPEIFPHYVIMEILFEKCTMQCYKFLWAQFLVKCNVKYKAVYSRCCIVQTAALSILSKKINGIKN